MKVPIAQEQVDTISGVNLVPKAESSRPAKDAFGENVAEARGQVARSISNAGDVVAQHAIQQAKWKAERFATDTLESMKSEIDSALINPDPVDVTDAQGNVVGKRPAGFLQRMGSDSEGATREADQTFKTILDKYMGKVKSPAIADMLYGPAVSYISSKGNDVTSHEAKQLRLAFTNSQTKALGNLTQEAATHITPDVVKNRANLNRALFAPGGMKDRIDQLNKFNGKGDADTDASSFRDWAGRAIEQSAINITTKYGEEAGMAQLTSFQKYMDSKKFNEAATTIAKIQRQINSKASYLSRVETQATTHELIDLANNGILAPGYLEEKFLTKKIANSTYKELQEKTTSDVGPTAGTDPQTYYDLTHMLLKEGTDPTAAMDAILRANNDGKLSQADARKIYEMHLVPSKDGYKNLEQAMGGGFDKTKEVFEANLKAIKEKNSWTNVAMRKFEGFFHQLNPAEKTVKVTESMQTLIDHVQKKNTPPHEYPVVADAITAAENLKKHPVWAALPKNGRKGIDRFNNKVIVYPDGRVVRAE